MEALQIFLIFFAGLNLLLIVFNEPISDNFSRYYNGRNKLNRGRKKKLIFEDSFPYIRKGRVKKTINVLAALNLAVVLLLLCLV